MNVYPNPRRVPMGWFCLALAFCGICLAFADAEASPRAAQVEAVVAD